MSNPFKFGDSVKYIPLRPHIDMTSHNIYSVCDITGDHVTVFDDNGDEHDVRYDNFELASFTVTPAPYQGAMGAGNRAKARATQARTPRELAAVLADSEEDDYDTLKANARVTSVGEFEAGQVLVYRDGTITQTTLTVKFCTATCVTFEETYSQAFNPNEFELEH